MASEQLDVLMAIDEWREQRFSPESRPSRRTVKRWIKERIIPGRVIGNRYYINVSAEARETGDPALDQFIEEIMSQRNGTQTKQHA